MFWGLIMEPHRRYTQKVHKAFHISMAALDMSTSSDEPAQVMCGFEGRNYLLCTLKKPDVLQCPLNLNFDVGNEVSFAANGRCHIHLTGYLTEDFSELEEEEDIDAEAEASTSAVKRSVKKETDDSPPPVKKSRNNGLNTSNASNEEAEEDSDDSDYLSRLLGNSLDDDDEEDSDASVDEEEGEAEEEEDLDEEVDESSLSEGDGEEEEEEDDEDEEEEATPKLNGVSHTKTEKQKKKKDKKNKEKLSDELKKTTQLRKESKTPSKENQTPQLKKESKTPSKENQTPKKKALQGGVIVEEIKEGQGPVAKNGKFVNVFYEGRLKQNNKLFDSTTKGAGFSFRLGNGEVIKGWDVGVAGMKVGGKRKIVCPPAMAYGQKGSPPAIPPNSTLVFEVELRKIN